MKTAHVHPQGGATRKEVDTLSEGLFWMMHTHTLSKKGVGRCFCFFLVVFLMKKKIWIWIKLFNNFTKEERKWNEEIKDNQDAMHFPLSRKNRPTIICHTNNIINHNKIWRLPGKKFLVLCFFFLFICLPSKQKFVFSWFSFFFFFLLFSFILN